jgi:quinoprotein glucose dehydrogenase
VPGEAAWPTQPVPTRPPPFDRQGFTEADVIDFTPELHKEALAILAKYHHSSPCPAMRAARR